MRRTQRGEGASREKKSREERESKALICQSSYFCIRAYFFSQTSVPTQKARLGTSHRECDSRGGFANAAKEGERDEARRGVQGARRERGEGGSEGEGAKPGLRSRTRRNRKRTRAKSRREKERERESERGEEQRLRNESSNSLIFRFHIQYDPPAPLAIVFIENESTARKTRRPRAAPEWIGAI